MAKKKTTSIEIFLEDKDKILELVGLLKEDMGFVSQRTAVMMAVHRLAKEKRETLNAKS